LGNPDRKRSYKSQLETDTSSLVSEGYNRSIRERKWML